MLIKELLNPNVKQYGQKKILEDIYSYCPHPSTVELQNIVKTYPNFNFSVTFLRSWFNNRHSKSKRDLNQLREQNVQKIRLQIEKYLFTRKMKVIDLSMETDSDNLKDFQEYVDKLKELQQSCIGYMQTISKLTVK
eukprot:NODE_714_length_4847_cov_0.370893.p4 type:complete len:136 gc:universal NODE_714_length_4847_cov_0.370893:2995-3402(+)